MSFKMTIQTKGVQGSSKALQEFSQGIEKELLRVLQPYASDTVSRMQGHAPVDTGYLRSQIRFYFPNANSVSINSWAPYSGFVNFGTPRMPARPFFTQEVEQGPQILSKVFAQISINYLRQVFKKHQNGPLYRFKVR
jgi:hypothetical protein